MERRGSLPLGCRACKHGNNDYDEYRDIWYGYCSLNVFLPWKKGRCKRQVLSRQAAKEER